MQSLLSRIAIPAIDGSLYTNACIFDLK